MAIQTVASWLDWAAMAIPNFRVCYENESCSNRIKGLVTIGFSYLVSSSIANRFVSEDEIAPQTGRSFVRIFSWEVCKFGALVVTAHLAYKFATSFLFKNAYLGRAVIVGAYEAISRPMLKQAFQTAFFNKEVSLLNKTQKEWNAFFAGHEGFFKKGYNKELWTEDVQDLLTDTSTLIDLVLKKVYVLTRQSDLKLLESAYWIQHVLNPQNSVDKEIRKLALGHLETIEIDLFGGLNELQDLPKWLGFSLNNLKERYRLLIGLDNHLKSITDEKVKAVIESPAQVVQEKLRINPQVEGFKGLMTFFGEPFISSKLISWYPSFFSTPILMSTVTSLVYDAFEQFLSYKVGFPSLDELPTPVEVQSALASLEQARLKFMEIHISESVSGAIQEVLSAFL